jgi:hypothetical protein
MSFLSTDWAAGRGGAEAIVSPQEQLQILLWPQEQQTMAPGAAGGGFESRIDLLRGAVGHLCACACFHRPPGYPRQAFFLFCLGG